MIEGDCMRWWSCRFGRQLESFLAIRDLSQTLFGRFRDTQQRWESVPEAVAITFAQFVPNYPWPILHLRLRLAVSQNGPDTLTMGIHPRFLPHYQDNEAFQLFCTRCEKFGAATAAQRTLRLSDAVEALPDKHTSEESF